MPDFPGNALQLQHVDICTLGESCDLADLANAGGLNGTSAATWPAANRAIYTPVRVEMPMVAFTMGVIVGVQSGNLDVGIYDEKGNRLVSAGSTAVGAAGFQSVNIVDTTLNPGIYYLAMNCDNTTATFNRTNVAALALEILGIQQQAVGAIALPNPATFANPITAYVPVLTAFGVSAN